MKSGVSQCQRPVAPRRPAALRRRDRRRLPRPRRRQAPRAAGTTCWFEALHASVSARRRCEIEPAEGAFLRLGVDDVRILGIAAGLEAVAAADDVPVAGADAGAPFSVRDGPQIEPLSCMPPQTL